MIPQRDESFLGFLKRLSDAEGYPDLGGFLTDIGCPYGRPLVENAENLAVALGVEFQLLEPLLPRSRPTDPALDWRFHRMHADPVCPACLAAGRPRRKEWRHALVSACAVHGTELLETCPGCESPLRVTDDGHASCICGAHYADAPQILATDGAVQISRAIAGLPANIVGFDLEGGSDRSVARTVWFLASAMRSTRTGKPGKDGIPKTLAEAREMIGTVEPLLFDWPTAFDGHVQDLWDAPEADGQTAAARLGSWYQGLMKQTGSVADALQERCLHMAGAICGDAYRLAGASGEGAWVSAAEGAKKLGIRAERIVDAVRTGKMNGRLARSGTGHVHTIVARSDIEATRILRSQMLDKTRAREFLGVGRKQFELLLEAHVVAAVDVNVRHPCVAGGFDRDDLTRRVFVIRKNLAPTWDIEEPTIAFRDLTLRRTTDKKALLAVFRAIKSGTIHARHFDSGQRLGDALFSEKEISDLLAAQGAPSAMTAGEVAKITGWRPECVTHWCAAGLLPSTQGRVGGADAWLIAPEDLAQFQQKYLVLADVAEQCQTTSRALISRLAGRGISPVGAKTVGKTARGHLLSVAHFARLMHVGERLEHAAR
ncbi:TniQ family protein [Pseudooceanicola onchidii]|uniref:TniQ family protein n=1 Tax=Pseudooceanicola onchidii TaxID=2562279 RepID=UPI0010AAED1D|nr:TniQ family protein [Pseudooceanicola onchidii]